MLWHSVLSWTLRTVSMKTVNIFVSSLFFKLINIRKFKYTNNFFYSHVVLSNNKLHLIFFELLRTFYSRMSIAKLKHPTTLETPFCNYKVKISRAKLIPSNKCFLGIRWHITFNCKHWYEEVVLSSFCHSAVDIGLSFLTFCSCVVFTNTHYWWGHICFVCFGTGKLIL